MPDGGAGKAVDHGGEIVSRAASRFGVEKFAGGTGCGHHLLSGTLADALGLAVAPDIGGKNRLVAFVDQVAHGLADQVRGNGMAGKPVLREQRPFVGDVIRLGQGAVHIKVVAPAGEFHAVVAHGLDLGSEFGEGKIGPLAGEKSDESGHREGRLGDLF